VCKGGVGREEDVRGVIVAASASQQGGKVRAGDKKKIAKMYGRKLKEARVLRADLGPTTASALTAKVVRKHQGSRVEWEGK